MLKQIRIILCAVLVIVSTVAATTYQESINKVEIITGKNIVTVNTAAKTVEEVLDNSDITLDKEDLVTPPLTAKVSDNMSINIDKAFMVEATIDGIPKHLKVNKGTVKNVKPELRIW